MFVVALDGAYPVSIDKYIKVVACLLQVMNG